jgi:pilus assembly protein Flp/PilA
MTPTDDLPRDEGAAFLEYGLLVTLIAVAVVATLVLLGPAVGALYQALLDLLA